MVEIHARKAKNIRPRVFLPSKILFTKAACMIYEDHGNLVADSIEDLTKEGWKIILNEPYKDGVNVVHATRTTYGINAIFNIFYVGTNGTAEHGCAQQS